MTLIKNIHLTKDNKCFCKLLFFSVFKIFKELIQKNNNDV
mgnify:CR=1 FL=1